MTKKGREDYMREICELKQKIADIEDEMSVYDAVFPKFYGALPKVKSGCEKSVNRAVQRAMSDAYVQWQEDEKL